MKPLPQGRELKYAPDAQTSHLHEAPPAGAWIEIGWSEENGMLLTEAPPAGAWIEIEGDK